MLSIDVVMRCRNEMPHAERAMQMLRAQQGVQLRLLVIDCASADGSRECAEQYADRVIDWDPRKYVPGVVLNRGMVETTSDLVAFINADAIAQDRDAVANLCAPFQDIHVAATFGRQIPRQDADPWMRLDTERAFGLATSGTTRNGKFFSMAASVVRRSWWQRLPFDESLSYSEDVDWTRRIGAIEGSIVYACNAVFEHSHQYDLAAQWRRRRGEGAADTKIFSLAKPSLWRECVRPLAGAVWRDAKASQLSPYGVATRLAQASGYWTGRRKGFSL